MIYMDKVCGNTLFGKCTWELHRRPAEGPGPCQDMSSL